MSTENTEPQVDGANTEVTEQHTEQAPQYSEIEQRAMEMGWRPRDEFNGTDDDFIDAKEFVRRKPLFDKIEHTTKEVKQLRRTLDALKTHYTKVQETEFKRALDRLKVARQEAISNGDGATFDAIDTEIKRVEKEVDTIEQVKNEPAEVETVTDPRFVSWTNRNPWYNSVSYMRKFADEVGVRLAQQGMEPIEVLKEVEKAVRKEFPNKFTNPNKANAPAVENGRSSASAGKADSIELTPQEKKIMNQLVSTGVLTKEEYLADLKKAKGIK